MRRGSAVFPEEVEIRFSDAVHIPDVFGLIWRTLFATSAPQEIVEGLSQLSEMILTRFRLPRDVSTNTFGDDGRSFLAYGELITLLKMVVLVKLWTDGPSSFRRWSKLSTSFPYKVGLYCP